MGPPAEGACSRQLEIRVQMYVHEKHKATNGLGKRVGAGLYKINFTKLTSILISMSITAIWNRSFHLITMKAKQYHTLEDGVRVSMYNKWYKALGTP